MFAQLLPPLATIRKPVRDRARIGMTIWCLLLFATDLGSWYLGAVLHRNNLWLDYLCTALSGAVLLWTLSAWQLRPLAQLTLRVLTPIYLLVHLMLVVLVENLENFSLVTDTLNGLLFLSVALYTLVIRSLGERERLTEFDWFWVCSGLALYYGCAMAAGPISRVLLTSRTDLLIMLLLTKSVVDTVAMMAITRGLLCPMPRRRSGGYSSPLSLRSSSS
jgi:hypothetical protein